MPVYRQVKSRDVETSRLTQELQEGSQVIIQFDAKLTSVGNSQNRGRFALESLSRGDYSQAAWAAEIIVSNLSDYVNYTLNSTFVNITFSCLADGLFRHLRPLPPFGPQPDASSQDDQTQAEATEVADEFADQFPLASE